MIHFCSDELQALIIFFTSQPLAQLRLGYLAIRRKLRRRPR